MGPCYTKWPETVFRGSLLFEKEPLSNSLPSKTDDRVAVSHLFDKRSEAVTPSQPKNKMDCQPRSPRGKRETAETFERVMSSVARQPGEKALHVLTASPSHCVSLSGCAPSFHHLGLPPPLLSCQQNYC